jgi:hypothetical protein
MFFTARQLEALYRENGGQVVLPYRARLTPAAQDWVRAKKVQLGYSDASPATPNRGKSAEGAAAVVTAGAISSAGKVDQGTLLWWCDGPCGAAKAAITAQEKESTLRLLGFPSDPKQLVPAIKAVAKELKAGTASSALLVVQNAAAAMVFANRCPSIRAVVGTCLDAVEQGVRLVAANVLVIEHPYKTLPQVKSMVSRFAKASRELPPDVQRQLAELAGCG